MSALVMALTATRISTDRANGHHQPHYAWALGGQLYKTGEGGELGRNTRVSIQRGKPFISIRLSRLRLFLTVRLLTHRQLLSTYKPVHQQDNKRLSKTLLIGVLISQ